MAALRNELAALKNRPPEPKDIPEFTQARTVYRNIKWALDKTKGTIGTLNLNLNKIGTKYNLRIGNRKPIINTLIELINTIKSDSDMINNLKEHFVNSTEDKSVFKTFEKNTNVNLDDLKRMIDKLISNFNSVRLNNTNIFNGFCVVYYACFMDQLTSDTKTKNVGFKKLQETFGTDTIKERDRWISGTGDTEDKKLLKKYFVYNLLLFYLSIINKVLPKKKDDSTDIEDIRDEWPSEGGGTLNKKLTKRTNRAKMKYTNMKYTKMKYTKKRNQKRKKNMSKKQRKHRQKKYTRKYI